MRRPVTLTLGLLCAATLPWTIPTAGAQTSGASVQVIDFEYTPRAVRVAMGASVLWSWDGSERHTVSARDGSFESGEKGRGEQFSFVFRTAGTFEYACRIHPSMVGTVTVQAAPPPSSPAPRPTSAAPSPSAAPTSARPSPSRTSTPPQPLPAPTSARPSPTAIAPSTPAAAVSASSAVRSAPELSSPATSAGPPVPSTSRSTMPLASLDEPRPKDRTGLAIALALVIAAAGIGLGTTLLLRGRLARKLSSPSP